MKPPLHQWFLIIALLLPAGCSPPRPSLFAPRLSVDRLDVSEHDHWRLQVRIKNDSYAAMVFGPIEARLQIAGQPPLPVRLSPGLEIPALAADAAPAEIPPSPGVLAALQASRRQPYGLPYHFSGQITASSRSDGRTAVFPFSQDGRFYPVPGDSQRYR